MKKHKVVKINGVKIPKEIKKWETSMKPRVPGTRTHKDPKHPTRNDYKKQLRKELQSTY